MKSSKVISLGEALIDRLGPLGGDRAFNQDKIDCFGGAPANVACALSRLGVDVSFIGSLGNDSFGQYFGNPTVGPKGGEHRWGFFWPLDGFCQE